MDGTTEESSLRPASRPRMSAAAITSPPRRRTAAECDDARRVTTFPRKLARIKSTLAVVLVYLARVDRGQCAAPPAQPQTSKRLWITRLILVQSSTRASPAQ